MGIVLPEENRMKTGKSVRTPLLVSVLAFPAVADLALFAQDPTGCCDHGINYLQSRRNSRSRG